MFCIRVFCYVVHMHKSETPDLARIRKEAKSRRRRQGHASYMQYLDLVARELYGVRHFHEAQAVSRAAHMTRSRQVSPTHHYLRSLQAYYLDF